jgi:hypothetical protein
MSNFKPTPASLRYLKARLQVFKRPMVWVSSAALLLSVFLVGEYLANPQSYTGAEDPNAPTTPPNQSLNNLPAQNTPVTQGELFEAIPELSRVPAQTNTNPGSGALPGETADSDPLLQEFLLGRSRDTTPDQQQRRSSNKAPSFATPSFSSPPRSRQPEVQAPSLYPSTSPSSSPTGDGLSSLRTVTNPLQSALDRYSSPSPNTAPQSSFSRMGDEAPDASSSVSPAFRTPSLSPTSTPDGNASQSGNRSFSPQLSPSPGTTGYTLPPAFRTPTPYFSNSTGSNTQPIPGQITPQVAPAVPSPSYGQPGYGLPSSNGLPSSTLSSPSIAPSPQVTQPSPFSVPRSVPGRSTGNGEINTFSNP